MRTISQIGINLIKKFEGCKLQAYRDSVGIWTIGWGNTFYKNGRKVRTGDKITQVEADELLSITADAVAMQIDPLITSAINQNQFDALCSFAYNVGTDIDADNIAEGLGDSTLLKMINNNPNDPDIKKEWGKWNKANGNVIKGLTTRRTLESVLYFTKF